MKFNNFSLRDYIIGIGGIILFPIAVWGLSQFGFRIIEATGVVFSAVLTGALVILYYQQRTILADQKDLMAIRYEPRIRIHEFVFTNQEMVILAENGGNGAAESISLRCDLSVNFEEDRHDEYHRMEEFEFKSNGKTFRLRPTSIGLRRYKSETDENGKFSQRAMSEMVKGGHIDTQEGRIKLKGLPQVIKLEPSKSGIGTVLNEILNELHNAGVNFVNIHFTVVCEDIKGEKYPYYVRGARGIELTGDFENLVEVFDFKHKKEGWGMMQLPEYIEDEIVGVKENPNSNSGFIAIGPRIDEE